MHLGLQRFWLAIRLMARSSQELANWRTILVSFLVAPILNVIFLVSLASVMGSADLVTAAYASVLINGVTSMIAAICSSVTRERNLGLFQEVLGRRLFNAPIWLSRIVLPAAVTLVASWASAAGVLVLDSHHDVQLFSVTCLLTVFAVLVGSGVGIFSAMASLGLSDPYMVGNILTALLPVTAGVIAPLSSYPLWARVICQYLPGSGVVETLRQWPERGSSALVYCAGDIVVGVIFMFVGLFVAKLCLSLIRSGRRSEQVF
jgi:ABC-2 type transport system permease protein